MICIPQWCDGSAETRKISKMMGNDAILLHWHGLSTLGYSDTVPTIVR